MPCCKVSPCFSERIGQFFDIDEFAMRGHVMKVIAGDGLDAWTDLNGVFVEIVNTLLKKLMISIFH